MLNDFIDKDRQAQNFDNFELKLYKRFDLEDDQKAGKLLIMGNQNLIQDIINEYLERFSVLTDDEDDADDVEEELFGAGVAGLLSAMKTFDPDASRVSLEMHKRKCIKEEIESFITRHSIDRAADVAMRGTGFEESEDEYEENFEDDTSDAMLVMTGKLRFVDEEDEKHLPDLIYTFFARGNGTIEDLDVLLEGTLKESVPGYQEVEYDCARDWMLLCFVLSCLEDKDFNANRHINCRLVDANDYIIKAAKMSEEEIYSVLSEAETITSKASFDDEDMTEKIVNLINGSIRSGHMTEASTIVRVYFQKEISEIKSIGIGDACEYDSLSRRIICFCHESASVKFVQTTLAVSGNGTDAKSRVKKFLGEYPDPRAIVVYLDKHVTGQTAAKWTVAISFHNHLKSVIAGDGALSPQDRALILYGPTGGGKTYIFECLREISPVNINILGANEFSSTGYKGGDIGVAIETYLRQDKYAVIVFDEIDKICRDIQSHDGTSFAVQSLFLMPLTGHSIISESHGTTQTIVDTSHAMFAFCGAFTGIDQNRSIMGFQDRAIYENNASSARDRLARDRSSIVRYGMMPELAGRIKRWAKIEKLTMEDLERMCLLENGPLNKWRRTFELSHGVNVEFEKSAIAAAAEYAGKEEFGARDMINWLKTTAEDKFFCSPDSIVTDSDGIKITITEGDVLREGYVS